MGAWHLDLSHATLEIRGLLKQNVPFEWTADTERSSELITDASYLGLGFILIQRDDKGKWHLIWCGSCSLTSAQTRYAPIMLELLAAVWGITSCAFYLRGIRSFTLRTNHKPLVGLMKKDLRDLTERQQILREKSIHLHFYHSVFGWQIEHGCRPTQQTAIVVASNSPPMPEGCVHGR